jgi:hypothetical protein
VTLNFYGEFFGCGLAGELCRVETLPPDDTAISVVINDGQGFFLDPADTQAVVADSGEEAEMLEFRLANGASVAVERTDEEASRELSRERVDQGPRSTGLRHFAENLIPLPGRVGLSRERADSGIIWTPAEQVLVPGNSECPVTSLHSSVSSSTDGVRIRGAA